MILKISNEDNIKKFLHFYNCQTTVLLESQSECSISLCEQI